MLVTEKPVNIKRVRHYFTLTPDCISKLEMAAFSYRLSTGCRKTRPSHIVERLVETDAIALGAAAIKSHASQLEQKAVEKWEGVTIHGQHKTRYGVMLKPELYRKLLTLASKTGTSVSELIEWTVRDENGMKTMNERMG